MLLLLDFVFISHLIAFCQLNKTFDCEFFSLDYPSIFRQSSIQKAPHMLMKLQSEDYIFSASYGDSGLDSSVGIWDDDMYEHYIRLYVSNGTFISIDRETINTKDGLMRCLKLKTNTHQRKQGADIHIKILSYLMLYKGYLFVFAFASPGKYTKDSPTSYPDKIMKGLKFKTTSINDFESYLIEAVKKLNAQCPIHVDDCTTHLFVLLSGKTIIMKTQIVDACEDFMDYEELKHRMCENFSFALEKAFVQYLDQKGYSIMYLIYNENERLKKKISISGREILNCYQ